MTVVVRPIFVLFFHSDSNNGLPDVMAVMMVEGYIKLVLTLGPHPNAPLELYMNRGDRLDDKQWHTVEVIRELKVKKLLFATKLSAISECKVDLFCYCSFAIN